MKYRKKPVVIDATQWFKNGDHPLDDVKALVGQIASEGQIVRYYRNPQQRGTETCPTCKKQWMQHGWIDTLEGLHNVCPGDWVITGIKGEFYPCKPDIFEECYESVPEQNITY
jgi:hypothetical protein